MSIAVQHFSRSTNMNSNIINRHAIYEYNGEKKENMQLIRWSILIVH